MPFHFPGFLSLFANVFRAVRIWMSWCKILMKGLNSAYIPIFRTLEVRKPVSRWLASLTTNSRRSISSKARVLTPVYPVYYSCQPPQCTWQVYASPELQQDLALRLLSLSETKSGSTICSHCAWGVCGQRFLRPGLCDGLLDVCHDQKAFWTLKTGERFSYIDDQICVPHINY